MLVSHFGNWMGFLYYQLDLTFLMKKYFLFLSSVLLLTACTLVGEPSDAGVCEYKGIAYDEGESYFDGCNWQTCQEDGGFVGTEMGCGERGDPIYKGDAGYEDAVKSN